MKQKWPDFKNLKKSDEAKKEIIEEEEDSWEKSLTILPIEKEEDDYVEYIDGWRQFTDQEWYSNYNFRYLGRTSFDIGGVYIY